LLRLQSREVETFLNCLWLTIGLSLISAWLVHAWNARSSKRDGLLPSNPLQFTALLLLIVLLFPVISLTDDIAVCTAPRDAEWVLRLHDPFGGSQPAQIPPPSAIAWMDLLAVMLRAGPSRPVDQGVMLATKLAGTQQPIDSRPPPAAL
jgi:hypothetical protein